METFLADDDYRARVARIEETRAIGDQESFDSVAPGHSHPMSDWRELPRQHDEQGITINARTAVTHWDGGPMDFGMAIDSLLYRIRAAKNPPRGGSPTN